MKREEFIKSLGLLTAGSGFVSSMLMNCSGKPSSEQTTTDVVTTTATPFFKISLAQWSLNNSIFDGHLSALNFPLKAKNDFGIDAVEYVNQFFIDKANDKEFLGELKKRCQDNGITSLLIMCDREGDLGDADAVKRKASVENHYKWVEAAQFLGCHSIRVNARGAGSKEECAKAATEGLHMLSAFAKDFGINVIVENHGGYSSDGQWLSGVIKSVGLDNCGTLPDFGNFCIRAEEGKCVEEYDRYLGVKELMPYAKGVSAKAHNFDEEGNCIETDFVKMLGIVKDAGFTGYIGIEYEGDKLSEDDGIKATLALLKKAGLTLS